MSEISKNIKAICKKQRIHVSTMETEAGIPLGTVSNWDKERRWMLYLPKIAKYLNVSTDSLFWGSNENFENEMDRLVKEIAPLHLSSKSIDTLIEMARSLQQNFDG